MCRRLHRHLVGGLSTSSTIGSASATTSSFTHPPFSSSLISDKAHSCGPSSDSCYTDRYRTLATLTHETCATIECSSASGTCHRHTRVCLVHARPRQSTTNTAELNSTSASHTQDLCISCIAELAQITGHISTISSTPNSLSIAIINCNS